MVLSPVYCAVFYLFFSFSFSLSPAFVLKISFSHSQNGHYALRLCLYIAVEMCDIMIRLAFNRCTVQLNFPFSDRISF